MYGVFRKLKIQQVTVSETTFLLIKPYTQYSGFFLYIIYYYCNSHKKCSPRNLELDNWVLSNYGVKLIEQTSVCESLLAEEGNANQGLLHLKIQYMNKTILGLTVYNPIPSYTVLLYFVKYSRKEESGRGMFN